MAPNHDELVQQVWAAHHDINRMIFSLNISDWLSLDLSMAQVKVLFVLQHSQESGEPTVGTVAQRLQIGLPAASHLIDKLVQAEMVSRSEDPADRRRTLVHLTESGRQLAARLRAGTRDRFQNWIAAIDDEDLVALSRGLSALVDAARRIEGASGDGGRSRNGPREYLATN
jgi:DNA-binding MarR family transcriptional regulator